MELIEKDEVYSRKWPDGRIDIFGGVYKCRLCKFEDPVLFENYREYWRHMREFHNFIER